MPKHFTSFKVTLWMGDDIPRNNIYTGIIQFFLNNVKHRDNVMSILGFPQYLQNVA